jgi:hypothetical protein
MTMPGFTAEACLNTVVRRFEPAVGMADHEGTVHPALSPDLSATVGSVNVGTIWPYRPCRWTLRCRPFLGGELCIWIYVCNFTIRDSSYPGYF